jgi:hypothetical protein
MSLAKCRALAANAELVKRRAARAETDARLASTTITTAMTLSANQLAWTSPAPSTRRTTAPAAIASAIATRMPASARAARCSAFPCPYGWPGSAGRPATPTAKKVSSAATKSVPE